MAKVKTQSQMNRAQRRQAARALIASKQPVTPLNNPRKSAISVAKKERTYSKEKVQSIAANAQTVINIVANFDLNAVQNMWLAVWSKIFQTSWNSDSTVPAYGPSYIQDAFVIMQQVTSEVMSAQTPLIKELPVFVQIILNLLAPKNSPFRLNMLKYSWSQTFVPQTNSSIPVFLAGNPHTWFFGSPDPVTEGQYNQLLIPFAPLVGTNPANLQIVFGLIENLSLDTKLMPTDSISSGKNDPSAFARTFSYLGTGNSAAGEAYGECEMETNMVKSWIPAQFSVFADLDTRVSRSFRNKSGDSCLLTTLGLIPGMSARDFKDQGPVTYKFIDFNEIYAWFVDWLKLAWTQALSQPSDTPLNVILTTQLNMSSQTFRIVLRQALLQAFTDQATSQFIAPKSRNGAGDNVFVPYLVHAGTYSTAMFGDMLFPIILAENIKMLKTTVLAETGNRKVKVVHIPVLGEWDLDTWDTDPRLTEPLIFATSNPAAETTSSIFGIAPGTEIIISLVDGIGDSAPPAPIYLNSMYYQTAMTSINNLVSLLTATGGTLSSVAGDGGPGLSLLNFTRYIATSDESMRAMKMRQFELLKEHSERIFEIQELKKKKSQSKLIVKEVPRPQDYGFRRFNGEKKKVMTSNPPGNVDINYTEAVSSNMVLSQDMQSFLRMLILPAIRPDPTDSLAPQIISEWQIAYVEANLVSVNTGGVGIASSFRSDDIFAAASKPIAAIQNGTSSSDVQDSINELVRQGHGPDWLKLMGGVVGAGLTIAGAFV